jgi:hypothetical protein
MKQEDMDQLKEWVSKTGSRLAEPMRGSIFVLMPFTPSGPDLFLALQLGMCLLYEKPLVVLALEAAYVPPRVLALADYVIRARSVEDAKEELHKVVLEILAAREKTQ